MTSHKVAQIAKDTCLTGLKNPHKTHEMVGQDVYEAVVIALDGAPCERCGNPMNIGGHGPGFCIQQSQT
jgi:hypothetical protein